MNDPAAPAIRVATIRISVAFELRRAHESAAQYHIIRVEPGEYPVELRTTPHGHRYIVAVFSGECLASGYGGKRYQEEEGKTSVVTCQPYKYEVRSGRYYGGTVEVLDADALALASGV